MGVFFNHIFNFIVSEGNFSLNHEVLIVCSEH